jgi:hypothetical protein
VVRNRGWATGAALVVGALAASVFWLYSPFLESRVARQVGEALKSQQLPVEVNPGTALDLKGAPSQALGSRYQMVSDGKQVFLADLKEGRVWRYFYHTKEGGFAKEDEGFLSLGLYYGGKKYWSAAEVEPALTKPGETPSARGQQPQ